MQPVQRGGTGGGHDGQGAAGGTDRALDLVREPVLTACMSAFSVPAMSPARGDLGGGDTFDGQPLGCDAGGTG